MGYDTGGKSVHSFNPDNNRDMSEGEVDHLVDSLGRKKGSGFNPLDKDSVVAKNTPPVTPMPSTFSHKLAHAFSFLNSLTPMTHKEIEATFRATSSSKSLVTVPSTSTSETIVFKDSDSSHKVHGLCI